VYYENNIPGVKLLYGEKIIKEFGKPRSKDEALSQYHKDIASSVQRFTEEIILHLLGVLQRSTKSKNICIAGGVAQNSVANGKIIANTDFERLYIPSAGHDAGISMGSALYHYNHILENPRVKPIFTAYTGKSYSNKEIAEYLDARGVKYRLYPDEDLFENVVSKLLEPGVIGWFSGRAEFGPRALGARSILADPRNADAKSLLNLKIKKRESFRPFAPSILKEYTGEYFERVEDVPFMEKVFLIKEEKRSLVPAVTHVDGTGRLQTVDKEVSPRYHRLIETFRKRTGIPMLLNTSFNENEPIVNSPQDALECFLRTQMDMLVLENCVIER